ncbi:uncharacterized protein M6B38_124695 [Iris pallida]|uniref:Acid phosphatase n=1 Tax=Iris pallida TaxID=29817 RepID=A0AAX6GV61_IRIPA|nr:uncharacterized protein M6B38_124695 [Iris pallida]
MSSFSDHHADSGNSSHSLLSRRGSEMGSQYVIENGVYMSAFTATVFVTALVTIGILMLTLLVSLTMMLDSCQSRQSGVIKRSKTNVHYDYCKIYAFHAELNNLGVDEFPTICKQYALDYTKEGQFLRDVNLTTQIVENYFSNLKPDDDHLDVILMDADDLSLLDITDSNISSELSIKHVGDAKYLASSMVSRLCMKLQASGWSLVFFTRQHTSNRNATIESLISTGFDGQTSCIMRSKDKVQMESWEYLSGRRVQLHSEGFRIASVISSQMDAFRGPCLGKQNFKLANLIHYKLEQ